MALRGEETAMNRGFAFYENYYATMKFLPQEQKEKFALAIIEYGIEGKLPEDGMMAALLQGIIPSIDNSVEKFNNGLEHGFKGVRPNKIADDDIKTYLLENPKATARMVADKFGLSESAVQKREVWKNRKNLAIIYQDPSKKDWKF